MAIRIEHGDCREVIPRLVAEGVLVDAIITDPPYGLEFMGAEWDAPLKLWEMGSGFSKPGIGDHDTRWPAFGAFASVRPSADRSGPVLAASDVPSPMQAYQSWCETWAREALMILRPGGFMLAFGGTRTEHRLACAIENVGFVIEDKFLWVHGQGFPKNKNLLKPACEVVTIAYQPGRARARQIGECRIEDAPARNKTFERFAGHRAPDQYRTGTTGAASPTDLGRWPTNFSHDGSAEVLAGFPDSAGQQGDVRGTEPSALTDSVYGERKRVPFNRRTGEASAERRYTEKGGTDFAAMPGARRAAAGSAARFFYQAKAGREDRWGSRHPTVKPVDLVKHLVALHCPRGGLFLDCFAGSGTAGVAALATGRDAILIEKSADYIADIRERMAYYGGGGRHSLASKNRNAREKTGPLL